MSTTSRSRSRRCLTNFRFHQPMGIFDSDSYSSSKSSTYLRDRVDFGYPFIGKVFKLGFQPEMLDCVVKLVIQRGIKPDVITYSSLMDGYCLHNQVDQAREIFDLMVSNGHTPNVVTYNILIMRILGEMPCKGLLDEALKVFRKMEGNGCLPSG
ncbi:hypothetical protein JCGZ_13367 [Jatropha curcas]|uniref:Pentatricopeptide repeat-containing protein n=1 Tax=Jatropha curcas TaxID=180498 RepID=A0A067K8K5_JATCU|nr:hypothetical protein JCGZ_13367 [Jatropha curcas]